MRRAERIRRSKKEKERVRFFRDTFKFAKSLLEEKKNGKLEATAQELEEHMKSQLGDHEKNIPLGSPGHVPRPAEPESQFDTPPRWAEIRQVVDKARSASAPGLNGVPYRVYKSCLMVLKLLWKLMRVAWKTQAIPSELIKAVKTFIPKEQDSRNISQFRGIALLNVEGKMFFSVVAKRMTSYLLENSYIDTSCQKAGIPGFCGCVEHSSMIWDQIKRETAKREKSDLHVVWLDLENAYGSVPHQRITFALDFFHIPTCIQSLNLRVDLDRQLKFPPEITTTSLRPDIILWSPSVKAVILAELTVPWEGGMEAAFEGKKEKYTGLAAECREAGWSICPVEVGCRGT